MRSILLFLLAGLFEIAGGYLVWLWLRDHRSIWIGALGGLMLFTYGVLPTLQPQSIPFGRVYAVYGGFFVVLSLLWGWRIDGTQPDRTDLIGAAIVLTGIAFMLYGPRG